MNVSTEQLFENARTQNGFTAEPVSEDQLRRIYDLMKWGPTSANSSPARIVFVRSPEAKEKLLACVSPGNVEKTRPRRSPRSSGSTTRSTSSCRCSSRTPMRSRGSSARRSSPTRRRFATRRLQGGYFIIAARAVGLDCGPMSGFDHAKMDAAFWAGTTVRTNFICSLGRGDPSKVFARSPRLSFEEACRIE